MSSGPGWARSSVCLIHTACPDLRDDRLEPPLGLLYIGAVLRNRGNPVTLVDLSGTAPGAHLAPIPDGFDVYGFSTYTLTYTRTLEWVRRVRAGNPAAVLLAGGPHATALPERVSQDGFDGVVTGEGERAIAEIMDLVEAGRELPRVVAGMPPEPLDALPFPAYELTEVGSYHRQVEGERSVSVLTSRGCPFRCVFCNSNIMGQGRRIRFRSAENVVSEIRWLKSRYGFRHFRFQDDVFTFNRKRLAELSQRLAEEEILYRCFARVNGFTAQVAGMLAESGCRHVSFGVESGSPAILGRYAMNKNQTPLQIRSALEHATGAGLVVRVFLIVGFPGETDTTIDETLSLMKTSPWDEFSVYPLIPYPGTPIHDRWDEFGIESVDWDYSKYLQIGRDFRAGYTIRTATFDEYQVQVWRDRVIGELLANGRTWAGDSSGFK